MNISTLRASAHRSRILLRKHPFALAWVAAFAFYLLLARNYIDLPPYHDATLTWKTAEAFYERPFYPFVEAEDTGHPPLLAWTLGQAWRIPLPRLWTMHLLTWAAAALLFAGVFASGYRAFGFPVALAAALLTMLHPVTMGQSMQLNFDIYLAAFAFLAIAGAATGRPGMLAAGCVLSTFIKLNGMFTLGPFLFWATLGVALQKQFRNWRGLLSAYWPMALALGLFALYTLAKYFALGYPFDSGAFEDGEQIALVSTIGDYRLRLRHSVRYMLLDANGNLPVFYLLLALGVILAGMAIFRPATRAALAEWSAPPAGSDPPPRHFWQPMRPGSILLLLWMMLIVQIALQSLRSVWTLVRYFMVCYPAIYLTLFAFAAASAPRHRRRVVLLLAIPILLLFMLRWHPRNVERVTDWLHRYGTFPPAHIQTNYENNLQFADYFSLLRRVGRYLNARHPEGAYAEAPWPFHIYLARPGYGIVDRAIATRPDAAPGKSRPDAILAFSQHHHGLSPEELAAPLDGYRRARVFRRGQVWIAVFEPGSPQGPVAEIHDR